MIKNANGINREIKVKRQKLGTVFSFKHLGAVASDDSSKPDILSNTEQTTAALTKTKAVLRDKNISLGSKVKLMCFLLFPYFYLFVILDLACLAKERKMLTKVNEHFVQRPIYQ